ncbi:glycosyltransferase family 2 protein [Campylobacter sp. MIT 99-7217]|uniref:glycosyltransferase family 2 protein n=1 Tax=Campylobacter sp. MIT 99-7217 TaxID=535091 RepID=UPI00163CF493|nr:glycosyltransferase family 2 protein [Campylobacter sp. MIT 99-7217]
MSHKISVIIPCYNSVKYLERSLGSVLKQSYDNWEAICIDDCSSDNTYEVLLKLAYKDKRIKVFRNEKNMGYPIISYPLALEQASGEFIFFLGYDDELSKTCFELLIKRYEELNDESIDIIVPDLLFYYPQNPSKNHELAGIDNDENTQSMILEGKEAFKYSLDWKIHGANLYKSSLVKKLGFSWGV